MLKQFNISKKRPRTINQFAFKISPSFYLSYSEAQFYYSIFWEYSYLVETASTEQIFNSKTKTYFRKLYRAWTHWNTMDSSWLLTLLLSGVIRIFQSLFLISVKKSIAYNRISTGLATLIIENTRFRN